MARDRLKPGEVGEQNPPDPRDGEKRAKAAERATDANAEALRRMAAKAHDPVMSSLRSLSESPTTEKLEVMASREALNANRDALGPHHPDTLNSMNQLAFLLLHKQQGS